MSQPDPRPVSAERRAWWKYCEDNQRQLDAIPFFEDFVKTLSETVDTKPDSEA